MAKELQAADQKFVIIDSDLDRLRDAEAAGCLVLVGDCTEEEVLLTAGIDRARVVASVLSDDAANVFLTLTARELNPTVQIIARAESPATEKKLIRSGANRVVLPTAIGATKIANLICRPHSEDLLLDEASRQHLDEQPQQIGLKLQEFPIAATSTMVGMPLGRVGASSKGGYVVVAVQHSDGSVHRSPDKGLVISAGDTLVLLGQADQMDTIALRANQRTEQSYRGHKI